MTNLHKIFILSAVIGGMMLPSLMMAQERYQVGVCDWMVLKRQKLGEFKLAKELGCDGIEMDMGGFDGVDEETKFYLNEQGNPVVCFAKYEVGPGYMGVQEFEIVKP